MKRRKSIRFGVAFVSAAVMCALSTPFGSGALHAAEYTGPHEVKWIRVGDLRQWYTNAGMEVEYGLIPRAMAQGTQQADEMMWEALYYRTDTQCSRGLWIGATEFADPISGVKYPFKVVQAGPRFLNTLTNFMPTVFKMTGKFPHPSVVVDGADGTDNTLDDAVEDIVPDQPDDRILHNVTITNIGIECNRTIYGSSQQNHDNYHIYEFVFKNTGVVDTKGTTVQQKLTGVIFSFVNRYAPGHTAKIGGWATSGNIGWGRNTVNQVIGQNPADPLFEMRATYAWYSPHSAAPLGYESDWGEPNLLYPGALGSPGFCGVVTLHADKSSGDPSDDPEQPKNTQWWDADANIMNNIDSYNMSQMTEQYTAMSAGHPASTQAELVGSQFADQWGPGIGGTVQMIGYGPYTMEPGDSVRIVMAEGVAGIPRRKSIEIGTQWYNNTPPYTMPDGSSSTDRNAYKKAWVWTAEDSILDMFRHAIRRFNTMEKYRKGLVPQDSLYEPPPPPESFTVSSGGDRIVLEWANNADSWPTFNGYQIYRAVSRPDTLYDLLFSCDKGNAVNRYDDISAKRGFNYYYYIVTKDDGSRNDYFPGVPLVSSKFYTVTNQAAYLRRPAVLSTLDSIRVVPNPFHIGARSIQFDQPDRIAFFGLPPRCTIKIYTERGDLIDILQHTNTTGDELWDSVTSSRQVVVSGLYIAVFESPDGKKTYRKFVIIR
jgi:hypothetical protein